MANKPQAKKYQNSYTILDFLNNLSTLYAVVLFVALSLFMPTGYNNLGLHKFNMFKGITIPFLIIALPFSIFVFFRDRNLILNNVKQNPVKYLPHFFVLAYGISHIISFIVSDYKNDALWGISGWNMGLMTQLMLVSIFFVIVLAKPDTKWVIYGALIGSAATFLLAILNRFAVYPINIPIKSPEFISTIGQTNWFCGYMTIFIGVGIGLFIQADFKEKNLWGNLLFGYLFISFLALWIQGSDTIFFSIGIILLVLMPFCTNDRISLIKYFMLYALLGLCGEIIYFFAYIFLPDRYQVWEENDLGNMLLRSHCGIILFAISIIILVFILFRHKKEKPFPQKALKNTVKIIYILVIVSFITILILMYLVTTRKEAMGPLYDIKLLRFTNRWGTSRGLIWKKTASAFTKLPALNKIFGVGTSCLYDCLYNFTGISNKFSKSFGSDIVFNAHNEGLTFLIENGILGV
ncbi:MAG: FUSC family protein, partial [Butyrivibrio sp.]|nr:FUSC family protein [Butyrivibrio sp.]